MTAQAGQREAQISALDDIIQRYNDLFGQFRKGELPKNSLAEFDDVRGVVHDNLELVEVTQDTPDILEALAGHDDVHAYGAATPEQILEFRAGGPGASKRAFSLVRPDENSQSGRRVLTAIYAHGSVVPVEADEHIHCSNLQGDVHKILTDPMERLDEPNLITFYSVTGFRGVSGAAGILIDRGLQTIAQTMPSVLVGSTLSPMRGVQEWAKAQERDLRSLDLLEQERLLHQYVCDLNVKDYARKLHVGEEGASLGWVHTNANVFGSKDDVYGDGQFVPMVNYLYDLDAGIRHAQKEANQKSASVIVHEDFEQELGFVNSPG